MDNTRLIKLLDSGASHSEIAKTLGCTRSAVSYAAKKLGRQPQKAQRQIDVGLLRKEVSDGVSFSEFCRRNNHTLAAVSKVAKKHGIEPPGRQHIRKPLPDAEIFKKYQDGVSLDALHNEYKVSIATIKRHLLSIDPDLQFRTMDEAKRPPQLNDPEKLAALMNKFSLREIAKKLRVRVATVQAATRRYFLTDLINRQVVDISEQEIRDLYIDQQRSITQIAQAYAASPASIARKLKEFGIQPRPACGTPRPSKHHQLNDKDWLYQHYVTQQKSMGWIAAHIGTSLGNVRNFLIKHEITPRTKREVYGELRTKRPKRQHVTTPWGRFRIDSGLEKRFLRSLPNNTRFVKREPIVLGYQGSEYVPDFEVDGTLIEVKPKGWMLKSGIDRQKYLKQWIIATKNNAVVRYWDDHYYDPEPISDEDIYFSLDWRLFFSGPEEVFQFYKSTGFRPLLWPKSTLLRGIRWIVPDGYKLDATYNCSNPVNILKHFNPHFWYSAHNRYNPIYRAFESGNGNVLQAAIETVWGYKRNINVYALVNAIKRHFKDFLEPSLFKPWIAQTVYDKLLPDGGVVFDPCIGWGGRLLGTVDRDIKYFGSDLNPKSVVGSKAMSEFLGAALAYDPELSVADAREVGIPDEADLIFTSPPYDNTEFYAGLDEQCSDTTDIYNHLFSAAKCKIALNIPVRHADNLVGLASRHGYCLVEEIIMKNRTLITRSSTYEPILVFNKKNV